MPDKNADLTTVGSEAAKQYMPESEGFVETSIPVNKEPGKLDNRHETELKDFGITGHTKLDG